MSSVTFGRQRRFFLGVQVDTEDIHNTNTIVQIMKTQRIKNQEDVIVCSLRRPFGPYVWHSVEQGVANINFWYERIFEYIYIQKTIRMNIRIYSYKKMIWTNIRIYLYQKSNTNEYMNKFVSEKWYKYDTNEYSYRKIFEYIRIKFLIIVLDLMLEVGFLICDTRES